VRENDRSAAQTAVARALPLLQSSAAHWTKEAECFSCHHQGLGMQTVGLAAELGFEIDRAAAEAEADRIWRYSSERFDALMTCDGVGVFGRATTLLALGALDRSKDVVTDSVVNFLASRQTRTGAWQTNEHRPPFETHHASATAWTIRALRSFELEGRAAEFTERIARAKAFLIGVEPVDNEEQNMRLLGLAWAGAESVLIQAAAEELLAQQNQDGGWSQIATLGSDPYATGQTLVALNQAAGVPIDDAAWSRGARYLTRMQREDGTWFVRTRRRIKGLPQVDSGFPYGRNQFISYFASCWSTMALALAAQESSARSRTLFGPARPRADEDDARERGILPIHRAAAFGSADELEQLLTAGADPDERGPTGMTALMLATHDLRKVELLLEHGAEADARSEWGFSPLLVAALTAGGHASVELLIERSAALDTRGVNGASALVGAASLGEVETVRALHAAGARFPEGYLTNALVYAANCDDTEIGEVLLELGADVNARSAKQLTALSAATIASYERFVAFALEHGADPDIVDGLGRSSLAWAARVDPGHTRVLDLMLAAGADRSLAATDGKTPLEQARHYRNEAHAQRLEALDDVE